MSVSQLVETYGKKISHVKLANWILPALSLAKSSIWSITELSFAHPSSCFNPASLSCCLHSERSNCNCNCNCNCNSLYWRVWPSWLCDLLDTQFAGRCCCCCCCFSFLDSVRVSRKVTFGTWTEDEQLTLPVVLFATANLISNTSREIDWLKSAVNGSAFISMQISQKLSSFQSSSASVDLIVCGQL